MARSEALLAQSQAILAQARDLLKAIEGEDWEQVMAMAPLLEGAQQKLPVLATLNQADADALEPVYRALADAVQTAQTGLQERQAELAKLLGSIRNEGKLRSAYGG